MSVQTYMTKDGPMHRVRWREGGKPRSRSFGSKREAKAFDIDVKSRRQRGEALPQTGRMTLGDAYAEWLKLRGYRLAKNTQKTYREHWDRHVKDRYDHYKLSEWVADPSLFDRLLADMDGRGVGPASQRKVLIVMSAVFTAAVEWKKVGSNPVLSVPKPSGSRSRIPHPFPPMVVERIRLQMRRRRTKDSTGNRRLADAVFVCLMSYAGLRPGEALALTWGDIGQRTLAIDKAMALGEEGPTKTGGARSAPLVPPLAADLHELWEARDRPAEDQLVLPSATDGYWSQTQYNNWRGRVWRPVMKALAEGEPPQPRLAKARPYDCRGSFVSLQLRAGASPLEVARWAGHSPKVMYDHYANVIDELEGEPRLPADEQIDRAREAVAELQRQELDRLMADLLSRPTVADCEDDDAAAAKFFSPAA